MPTDDDLCMKRDVQTYQSTRPGRETTSQKGKGTASHTRRKGSTQFVVKMASQQCQTQGARRFSQPQQTENAHATKDMQTYQAARFAPEAAKQRENEMQWNRSGNRTRKRYPISSLTVAKTKRMICVSAVTRWSRPHNKRDADMPNNAPGAGSDQQNGRIPNSKVEAKAKCYKSKRKKTIATE